MDILDPNNIVQLTEIVADSVGKTTNYRKNFSVKLVRNYNNMGSRPWKSNGLF